MIQRAVMLLGVLLLVGVASLPFITHSAPMPDAGYGFQRFWETHHGALIFGQPLTEAFEEQGRIVQYFEHARLEYVAEPEPAIEVGLLGREYSQWRTFPAQPPIVGAARSFTETAYVIRPPFQDFWEHYGGVEIFGLPISAPLWEQTSQGRFQVQYFERALFIYHPVYAGTHAAIELAPLGRNIAQARGFIDGPRGVAGTRMFEFVPQAPIPTATAVPPPTIVPPAPVQAPSVVQPSQTEARAAQPVNHTNKSITISIAQQWLYAYEGSQLVFDAPVTTGKDGFNTPTGTYAIYAKVPLQTMRGSLGGESWVVPDVPHAMYFNGGVALHGTYWHNLFGSGVRISHGCVNLPLESAAWLYSWAQMGTSVQVTP